jgi:hypothetical protein
MTVSKPKTGTAREIRTNEDGSKTFAKHPVPTKTGLKQVNYTQPKKK